MRRITLLAALLVTALTGLIHSYYMTALVSVGSKEVLPCTATGAFDCAGNLHSAYGKVFGLPVSVLASIFFACLACHALLSLAWPKQGSSKEAGNAEFALPLALGYVAGGVVLYFLALSLFVLHSLCLHCLAQYGLVGLGIGISYVGLRAPPRRQGTLCMGLWKDPARLFGSLAPAFCIGWFSIAAVKPHEPGALPLALACNLAVSTSTPSEAAMIEVLEFADFECPACKIAGRELERLREEFPGRLKIQYVHFPLCQDCNPEVSHAGHRHACLAARAGVVMKARGKFDAFSRRLNETDAPPDEARIRAALRSLDEDETAVLCEAASARTGERLRLDIERARRLGVQATPTLIVGGRNLGVLDALAQIRTELQGTNPVSVAAATASAEPALAVTVRSSAAQAAAPQAAALWSGVLHPSRATDWSRAGVVGGIPSAAWPNCVTAACNTLFGGTVTAASIQSALASAPANSVVRIPAGTFTLTSGFTHSQSNVVLRGAGSSNTKLVINGTVTGGGLGLNRAISFLSGVTGIGRGGSQSANWTAGYAQGANVITLSSTNGLLAGPVGAGSLLYLDQLNDASDGYPAAGDLYVCENGPPCSNQGGNNYARLGRAQVQVVTVTGISGNQVTISPGLAQANWRASQSPGAYWVAGAPLHNAGIENLAVDYTGGGGSGLFIKDAANCWVSGTRWIKTDPGTSESYGIFTIQAVHLTIRSNYLYTRPYNGGAFPLANYSYTDQEVSDIVYENNINHGHLAGIVPNDPSTGNVFAYNYIDGGNLGVAGIQLHSGSVALDLFEGNNMQSFMGDIIHGPHYLGTLFRNHFDGNAHNNSQTTTYAIGLNSHNRFFNLIGNVMGSSSYSGYEQLLTLNSPWSPIYSLGWQGNASGGTMASDPDVPRTTMRWGNWDSATNSSRFVASEVPSGIANYSNPVPATQALPPSLYLPAPPRWWRTPWGTPKWPAIGPDVTGGNVTNSPTGGHAEKIPARLCFEHAPLDPAYPNSTPRIRLADLSACYNVAPPRNLDFNGDGKSDILFRHPSSGDAYLWLMK